MNNNTEVRPDYCVAAILERLHAEIAQLREQYRSGLISAREYYALILNAVDNEHRAAIAEAQKEAETDLNLASKLLRVEIRMQKVGDGLVIEGLRPFQKVKGE